MMTTMTETVKRHQHPKILSGYLINSVGFRYIGFRHYKVMDRTLRYL